MNGAKRVTYRCLSLAIVLLSVAVVEAQTRTLQPPANDSSRVTIRGKVPFDVTWQELVEFVKKVSKSGPPHPELEAMAQLYFEYGEGGEGHDSIFGAPLRWDWAYFQMIQETKWATSQKARNQNNFAGIGAATIDRQTGAAEKGETFADVSDGVKAHLQHLAVYAGVNYKSAGQPLVAKRTSEIHDFRLGKARTFADLSGTWCTYPDEGIHYGYDIAQIASRFGTRYQGNLAPELTAEFEKSFTANKDRILAAEFKLLNDIVVVTRPFKGEVSFVSTRSTRGTDRPVLLSLLLKSKHVPGQPSLDLDLKLLFDPRPMKATMYPNGVIVGQAKLKSTGTSKIDLFGTGSSSSGKPGESSVTWRLVPTTTAGYSAIQFLETKNQKQQYKTFFVVKQLP